MSQYYEQLAQRIRDRFGDRISDSHVAFGELTVTIDKDCILPVAEALRDEQDFAFQELIDVCGVDYSEYNIDGEDWHLYENPFRIYVNGEHTIGAFSVDIYENIEVPVYSTFKMDNEKPTLNVAIEGDQINGWYITPVTVTCTADDQVSGINAIFYRLEKDDIFDEEWFEYDGPIVIDEDGE